MKRLITGNEALALGALRAGVTAVTGYPGTPSTGALAYILDKRPPGVYVEWSTNEKVAFEVATGVSWTGRRALCTMKMSGVNVAYNSLISVAYSGCDGGLVIYTADDPGASAGMPEQDSRGFAILTDLPMLEPASVAEVYDLTTYAFELSERVHTPVFVRLVTALALSSALVEVEDFTPPSPPEPVLVRDIQRYTKAGALICTTQHLDLIARLRTAGEDIYAHGINQLIPAAKPGGLGVIASGVCAAYLEEGFRAAEAFGAQTDEISVLKVHATHPFPAELVQDLMSRCSQILVLEELEPYLEKECIITARRIGFNGRITGKIDGPFQRSGEYGVQQVVQGLAEALNLTIPAEAQAYPAHPEELAAARPITVCAGCPHRGTYLAINAALRKLHYKANEVMVTGDIGCTILGMNPPFNTVWNEVSMGASIGLAQGFVHAGLKTPVLATIGDSTFFHAGISSLINAVQHNVNLTLVILDNRWTAMTGMQVNPGTPCAEASSALREVDIASIVKSLGVDTFLEMDPYDLAGCTETLQKAIPLPGVKVILARRECALQVSRSGETDEIIRVIDENCNLCKLCIMQTGCAAISLGDASVTIDQALCNVCGLCVQVCNRDALIKEPV